MTWSLLPYQRAWIRETAPLAVIEKSRRIGISWAEAYHAVMHAADDRGDIYYQSYDKEMTRGFIEDCAGWIETLDVSARQVGEQILADEGRDIQVFRINFASGRRIIAMTSSPRGFRGKGRPGDLAIVDEAAFVDDIDEVLKAALSFTNWGGRVRIISTHNGEGNAFNALVRDVRDGRKPGALHRVTLRAALDQGLHARIAAVTGQPDTPQAAAEWEAAIRAQHGRHGGEELDCIPAAGGGAWITFDLIRAAESAEAGQPDRRGSGPTYIGVDIARRRDLWVAAVIEESAGTLWLREMTTLRDAPFSAQRAEVRRLAARHRPLRILVDQTGMGEAVVEQIEEDHGRMTVEGVLLTASRRLDVASGLRKAFEDRRIRIPADEALRADLHSVRAEPGATGAPRLVAARATTDGHADRFWAIALAVTGARSAAGPFRATAAGAPSPVRRAWGARPGYETDADLGMVRSALDPVRTWRT
ncbi:terminase large subunit domain-containing protein [Tateyamaria sp.]|uniref:phage terminase large subunit family protein n=1 Tax=Tateyamaria sp. TaxID=1929288 RepID=UPI003B221266